jgi:hypothetical protein
MAEVFAAEEMQEIYKEKHRGNALGRCHAIMLGISRALKS